MVYLFLTLFTFLGFRVNPNLTKLDVANLNEIQNSAILTGLDVARMIEIQNIILSLYINASISGYENYPVTLGLFSALRDSLFAPLATARCSDAGSFTRSEPSHPRTTPHVSTNRNHMREARGWMRVRSLPNPRVRGRKTSLRWARARLSWGASKVNR